MSQTKPAYSELVAAIRREGSALLAASSLGLDADVPACPDWVVGDLLSHIGGIYRRVAGIVGAQATSSPEQLPPLENDHIVDTVAVFLDDLVLDFSNAAWDSPAWNWTPTQAQTAEFWARRMAHESAIHRYDAQAAHGVAQPIEPDLATDGLDEFIDVLAPRVISRDEIVLPDATVVLSSTDSGAWTLGLSAKGIERLPVAAHDCTTVAATSSELLLAVTGRTPWSTMTVTGDFGVLTAWSDLLKF